MARAITKTFGNSETIVTIRRIDNGKMVEEVYTLGGKRTQKSAQIEIRKALKTQNFMIVNCETSESEDEESYTVSANNFWLHSSDCVEGESYGREFVTATFKVTVAQYFTMNSEDTYYYLGVTTQNKLRRAIAESINDDNILVGNTSVIDVRRFMTREQFIELARNE